MRILVIEDELWMRTAIRRMLRRAGFEVLEACDGEAGIEIYRQQRADLVIIDLMMPRKNGLETILELRLEDPGVKVIATSGNGADHLAQARMLGALHTVPKPFLPEEMLAAVKKALA